MPNKLLADAGGSARTTGVETDGLSTPVCCYLAKCPQGVHALHSKYTPLPLAFDGTIVRVRFGTGGSVSLVTVEPVLLFWRFEGDVAS